MRILQLTHQYPPEYLGGVELITQQLARGFVRMGHESHVVTLAHAPAVSQQEGVVVHRLRQQPSLGRRFLATFNTLPVAASYRKVLNETQPELVLIQHMMGHPYGLLDMLRQHHIPTVLALHDYWHVCANGQRLTNFDHTLCDRPGALRCARCIAARAGFGGGLAPILAPASIYRAMLLRSMLKDANAVIANSHYLRDWYSTQNIDTTRWHVTPPGIDFPTNLEPARDEHDAMRVTYVGSIAQQKGVHNLIQAFNASDPRSRLDLIGDPASFPAYVAELSRIATHPGVRFMGTQNRKQVWHALAESDVVVVPSLVHESANLVAREAVAAGCWLIASRLGALTELIVSRADLGVLVEPDAQSIQAALLSAQQRLHEIRSTRARRLAVAHPLVRRTVDTYAREVLTICADTIVASGKIS